MSDLVDSLAVAIEALEEFQTGDKALAAWIAATAESLIALQAHLEERERLKPRGI